MFYLSCFNRSLIFLNTTPEFRHSQTWLSLLLPFCAPRFAFVKLLFLLSRPLCWMFPIGSCSFPYIQLNGSQPYRLLLHWLIALQNAVELLLWDLKRLRGRGSFSWQPWKSIENVHGQPGQPSTVWPQWVWWIYRNNIFTRVGNGHIRLLYMLSLWASSCKTATRELWNCQSRISLLSCFTIARALGIWLLWLSNSVLHYPSRMGTLPLRPPDFLLHHCMGLIKNILQ